MAGKFGEQGAAAGADLATGGSAAEARPPMQTSLRGGARLWHEIGAPYEAAVARTGTGRGARRAAATPAGRRSFPSPDQTRAPRLDGFLREGDYWSITFDGHTVRVRDLKGMRYLARLLVDPGREFHVLDLVAAESGRTAAGGRAGEPGLLHSGLGDARPLLDAQAKEAYRRRLAEIEDDLGEALAIGDDERAAQADVERDLVIGELTRAVGLGGRDRRAASASERARASVTRAVRQAIARIRDHHPSLEPISTGRSAPARTAPISPNLSASVEWKI